MPLYGGIEAGGTKFVCAVGTGPDDVRAEIRFPTAVPARAFRRPSPFQRTGPKRAAGRHRHRIIWSHRPDPRSAHFGYVTTTPKPGWAHTDFAGAIHRALGVPVGFDTDVNVAALGEHRWGAAQGLDTFIYLTVGTGIGGGGMVNGRLIHGLMHPEMGHVRIPHDWEADPYPGFCSYHGDCLEGLAAGPALAGRWGIRGDDIADDHPAWEMEAHYLALGLVNFILTMSPQRIIVGGGVMEREFLYPMVRKKVQELLNGYLQAPAVNEGMDEYIVAPGLGNRSGVLGAIALADSVARGELPGVGATGK